MKEEPLEMSEDSSEEAKHQQVRRSTRKKTTIYENCIYPVKLENRYDKRIIKEACEQIKLGLPIKVIAQDIGASVKTVSKWNRNYRKANSDQSSTLKVCNQLKQEKLIKTEELESTATTGTAKRLKYNPIVIRKICKRLKQGESARDLASEFGINYNTINWWKYKNNISSGTTKFANRKEHSNSTSTVKLSNQIKKENLAENDDCKAMASLTRGRTHNIRIRKSNLEPKSGSKYNKSTITEALKRMKQGKSVNSVARELGVHPSSVFKWKSDYLSDHQATPTDGLKHDKKIILKACELLRQGYNLREVAAEIGVSISMVHTWRHKFVVGKEPTVSSQIFSNKVKDELAIKEEPTKIEHLNTMLNKVTWDVKNSLKRLVKMQHSAMSKTFTPFRKVYIPNKLKLLVVKLIHEGIPMARMSNELHINGLTLMAWLMNKDLLKEKIKIKVCNCN